MREIRLHGSEGGGAETNRSFLPLSMRSMGSGDWTRSPDGGVAMKARSASRRFGDASTDSTWSGMRTSSKRAASTSTHSTATKTTNGELSATMIMGGEVTGVH